MLGSAAPVIAAGFCPARAEVKPAKSRSRIAEALMNDVRIAEDICDNLTDVPIY
jgi:hypothetical protein